MVGAVERAGTRRMPDDYGHGALEIASSAMQTYEDDVRRTSEAGHDADLVPSQNINHRGCRAFTTSDSPLHGLMTGLASGCYWERSLLWRTSLQGVETGYVCL